MYEFSEGMRIVVFLPDDVDRYETDEFNAGWADGMEDYIDQEGTIISGPHEASAGGFDYQIKFDDGETWWWDERYMRLADMPGDPVIEIDEDTFNEILN